LKILNAHAVLVAVHLEAGRLIKGANTQPRHEIRLLECVPGDTKDQSRQPFVSRARMQKPALRFVGRSYLHNGAVVPVRGTEGAGLVYPFLKPIKNAALPAARSAFTRYAFDRVPVFAVLFPGHLRVLADL